MDRIPTDLEILEDIYNRYYGEFRKYAKKEPDRIARIRVPVDVEEIADACGVEEDMIFGRIYYHFNKKYSYKNDKGEVTTFFTTDKFEGLSVIFPLVASILAEKYEQKKQKQNHILIAGTAIAISILALITAFLI